MPTKRTFDLVVITALLLHPAVGLVRMAAKRWTQESRGVCGKLGQAIQIGVGQ
jgi:hypothetical protein